MMSGMLTGAELTRSGIQDLRSGMESVPAYLASIGPPHLRRPGLPIPEATAAFPELRPYERLQLSDPDAARSRPDAPARGLVNYERAAESAG